MLDDHKVSAPVYAGAKTEVAASKTRVLTARFVVLKLWLWTGDSNIWSKRPSELKLGDHLAVYTLDDHKVSAPLDAGAKA
jgi:hypothetical protein